ncbi:MAG: S41 family peptidase [Gemmatimonadales bacterium]
MRPPLLTSARTVSIWLIIAAIGAACSHVPASTPVAPTEPIASEVALLTFDTVWSVVRNTYVDRGFVASKWSSVRDSLRPRAALVTDRKGLTDLLATTLKHIPDSHFYIIPEGAAETTEAPDQSEAGGSTGISVRAIGDDAVVWTVDAGSPAAIAGIMAGATVSRISDRDLSMALRQVRALPEAARPRALSELLYSFNRALSPATGKTVNLQIVKGGRNVGYAVVAVPATGTVSQFGNLPPIAGRVVVRRLSANASDPGASCVGVIAFNVWLPALVPELEKAMDAIHDCAGVVVDLRGNPGGVGTMVMGFGGYFVDSAISLGTMRSRDLSLRFTMNPRRVKSNGSLTDPFEGPLAIIVDPMTASTSEIFAAGMQRIGRARVFGERSAGEALPAVMDRLPSGDVFVHAVADFTDPTGNRIEGAGVVPDEMTPLSGKALAEGRDTALEAAIRWIRSKPALQHSPA